MGNETQKNRDFREWLARNPDAYKPQEIKFPNLPGLLMAEYTSQGLKFTVKPVDESSSTGNETESCSLSGLDTEKD